MVVKTVCFCHMVRVFGSVGIPTSKDDHKADFAKIPKAIQGKKSLCHGNTDITIDFWARMKPAHKALSRWKNVLV